MASIYKIPTGWRAQIRLKGKTPLTDTFATKREAQQWAAEQETLLRKSASVNRHATFGSILEVYRANSAPGADTKQATIKYLEQYWKDWRLSEIHSGSVTTYVNKLQRQGLGPSTIKQYLSYMGSILRHGGVLAGNDEALLAREKVASSRITLQHLGAVADSTRRDRRPTDEELELIAEYFEHREKSEVPMTDIMLFAISTCCRIGEIVGPKGIRFEDFNPTERTLIVRKRKHPRIKGGVDDVVPLLCGPVIFRGKPIDPVEILLRQPVAASGRGRVFPWVLDTVEKAFRVACTEHGIEDLRFHDLRHEGVSRLFEAGFDIPQVAKVSGHKSWKHLQRYTHLRASAVRSPPQS